MLRGEAERAELLAAAAADNHPVLYPTHVLEDGGRIVGYASAPWSPTIYFWADSKRVKALSSVRALQQVERIVGTHGWGSLVVPCAPDSPFHPILPRLGYRNLGRADFFTKTIGGH